MKYDPYYHHRRSIRLKGYDYSSEGYYFVTMCSLHRKNLFADLSVRAGLAPALQSELAAPSLSQTKNTSPLSSSFSPIFNLTRIGEIIDKQWKEIPQNYNNVKLDNYVVMPNHFHCIFVIGSGWDKPCSLKVSTQLSVENQSKRALLF